MHTSIIGTSVSKSVSAGVKSPGPIISGIENENQSPKNRRKSEEK